MSTPGRSGGGCECGCVSWEALHISNKGLVSQDIDVRSMNTYMYIYNIIYDI